MTQLNNKAMLVRLSISQWTARKFDKKITEKVDADNNAKDAGRYNKSLIARDAIKTVQKTANAARTFHYENTLPWSDNGDRILPAANYLDYTKGMQRLKESFESTVKEFVDNYPALIDQARIRLNGMFNPDDYPGVYEISRKYAFDTFVNPLPDAQDFRVNLQGEEIAKIQKSIEQRSEQAQRAAMADLWSRLFKHLENMVNKLGEPDAVFRDSLVNNLCDLCQLLPRLNLIGDPDLEKMRQDIEDRLCAYDPDDLRNDKTARKAAKDEAQNIMDKMSGYMGG